MCLCVCVDVDGCVSLCVAEPTLVCLQACIPFFLGLARVFVRTPFFLPLLCVIFLFFSFFFFVCLCACERAFFLFFLLLFCLACVFGSMHFFGCGCSSILVMCVCTHTLTRRHYTFLFVCVCGVCTCVFNLYLLSEVKGVVCFDIHTIRLYAAVQ